MKPDEIEKTSFTIIRNEMSPHSFSAQELPIIQRVIHATADFDYQRLMRFSPAAIHNALFAIRSGTSVFSDVQMIAAGVSNRLISAFGTQVECFVNDPKVVKAAISERKTRSELAMRAIGKRLAGSIVLIGNAPTALFEVVRLYQQEGIRPAFIVGVPVGFVNAVESKAALMETNLDYISVEGRKGGSTVAVAIMNALLRLASEADA
ncbi:MAG: precorrin-8X methylmutase [Anaerolineaceae bacterium]|nr:precorrin-8X methylmutase [Anaerolineaceae bacterium]